MSTNNKKNSRFAVLTNRPSESAQLLRDTLAERGYENSLVCRIDKPTIGSKSGRVLRLRSDVIPINWGCSSWPEQKHVTALTEEKHPLLNSPLAVRTSSCKLRTFEKLAAKSVKVPPFTTDKEVAKGWLAAGDTVVVRHKLRAHGGAGVVIVKPSDGVDAIPDAPLYTGYQPGIEYRVHIRFGGSILDVQQKRWRDGAEKVGDYRYIKNYDKGWVFTRQNLVEPPYDVMRDAGLAVLYLGLDFGAVDLRYAPKTGRWAILEVNSAPGLAGSTVHRYADVFDEYAEDLAGLVAIPRARDVEEDLRDD